MRGKWSVFVVMLVAIGGVSCARDPVAAKRQYVAQGDRYVTEKKYAEAILAYRNALRQDAKFGEARLKLSDTYGASGDFRNALRELVNAADLMPDSVDVQVRAGRALLFSGQYPEAKARAIAALAKDPRNVGALMLLGNALASLKDLDGAIEQVQQAIDQNPQITLGYANLGALYVAKGDREAAEATFKRAVEVAPKSVDAHLSLANFRWATDARDEAEREIKIALQLEPKSATANRALAVLYLSENKANEAEPYLKTYADVTNTVESQLVLADYYAGSRKIAESKRILTKLATEKSGFVPATLRLAVSDFSTGSRAQAYRELEAILKQQPKNAPALETKARFLLVDGKTQEALTLTKALVDANEKSATGHYLHGVALEANGSIDEAISAFQSVLQLTPSAVDAQVQLASLYLRQGNAKGALDLAQQALKAQPQSAGIHFLYAQALLKSNDLPNAERELLGLAKAAANVTDVQVEVQTWLGMLYETRGDLKRARDSYQKASDLAPKATAPFGGLVGIDLDEKKPAAALARVQSRLAASPNDAGLLLIAANVYTAMNDWPKAEASYRKVLELDPANVDAYNKLGAVYLAENRLDEARKSFEDMARRQSKPVAAETMLGLILARQGKREESRKHFERALALDSRAAVAANNLAWDYANYGGNLDMALQLAQTAKSQSPLSPDVSDTLGWIYYKKGLARLAVTTLREAAQQNPTSPDIQYHLGLALLKDGQKVDAKAALQHVLKLNPQFADADEVRRVLAGIES